MQRPPPIPCLYLHPQPCLESSDPNPKLNPNPNPNPTRHWVDEATGSKAIRAKAPGGYDPQFGPRDFGPAPGIAWEQVHKASKTRAKTALVEGVA